MSSTAVETVISDIEEVATGVRRVTLAAADGRDLPSWSPGAHIDLHFSGRDESYTRQYSLCGDPADRSRWQVAVLHVVDGRGGSAYLHSELSIGQRISASLPRNNFPLQEAPRYLFIAGGIGITPILPMITDACDRGADWNLIYCGRSADSMAFVDEIESLGSDRVERFPGDSRRLEDLPGRLSNIDPNTRVYCCGPERLIADVTAFGERCLPERVHVERFRSSEPNETAEGTAFEVEFADTGVTAQVPSDRSILDLAEELGIPVESSCQEGVCGTCESRIICGTPDHRDDVLTEAERQAGETMMICVSRSLTPRLTLEL